MAILILTLTVRCRNVARHYCAKQLGRVGAAVGVAAVGMGVRWYRGLEPVRRHPGVQPVRDVRVVREGDRTFVRVYYR